MPFAMALLPSGMALFPALATGVAAIFRTPRRGVRADLTAVFAWSSICAASFSRAFLEPVRRWAFVDTPIAQGAALVGLYGLTFAAMLPCRCRPHPGTRAFRFVLVAAALALLGGPSRSGRCARRRTRRRARAWCVQPDNPQSDKAKPAICSASAAPRHLTFADGAAVIDFVLARRSSPFSTKRRRRSRRSPSGCGRAGPCSPVPLPGNWTTKAASHHY